MLIALAVRRQILIRSQPLTFLFQLLSTIPLKASKVLISNAFTLQEHCVIALGYVSKSELCTVTICFQ